MKTSTKQALADRSDRPGEIVASGHQVEMIFRPGQKALSLRAAKLWHLLVKATGVDLAANKLHTIPLAKLYQSGIGHMTQDERIEALRELQTTLIEVRVQSPKVKGRMRTISGSLLAHIGRDEDDRGDLVWEFSRALRTVFANSDHWAVLSKRAVMAFESRYSLRLYEIVALRSGLDHKTSEIFSLEDLRSRLGVPPGKLKTWPHLRQFALERAITEVNQLAGFTVGYEPIKKGRAVTSIKLTWGKKPATDRKAARRELDRPKVGRKARRDGTAETPPLSFPTSGSVKGDRFWEPLARDHVTRIQGGHVPDLRDLTDAFRSWCVAKGIPLDARAIDKTFIGFCRNYKPLT